MVDRVKAGFDVPFQDPCWHVFPEEYPVALGYCVRTAAFLSEPIRMGIRLCFGYWVQCLQVQGLHPTVFHGGDPYSTLPHYPKHLRNSSQSPIPITRCAANGSR